MVTRPSVQACLGLDATFAAQGDISGRRSPKKLFNRGQGHYLFDADDAVYLDFQLCNGASPFGYANPDHVAAITAQAERLSALSSEFIAPERASLAEALCHSFEASFGVKGRVHFTVSGAQAVDDALKLCTRRTGRRKVLAMEGGYHGRTIAASNLSASYRYRSGLGYERGSELVPFPYCARCPYGMRLPQCELFCLSQVRRLFESEAAGVVDGAGGAEVGAIFVESVLGRGGHVGMPTDYLCGLRQTATEQGLLLVIDDVQMGLMRTGRMWTPEHAGIVPDVVIFGKAITNGMFPTAGFWARDDIADPENWPVGSSHATFAAAPIGMALGLVTMRMLEDETLPARIEAAGKKLERVLYDLAKDCAFIHAVNRRGLALSIDVSDPESGRPSPALAHAIVERSLAAPHRHGGQRYGLICTHGGMHGQMVMFAPPYRVDEAEVDLFATILANVLSDVGTGR